MKNIYSLFFLLLLTNQINAQNKDEQEALQDPAAKEILDRVSNKMLSYQTIMADFELVINNRVDKLQSKSRGAVQIKGNKYYMESMGSMVFFNGKTLWSYMPDINEVTVSEPDSIEGDFIDNPALIFTFYNRDFKYRLIGEARIENRWMYEIDLFPKNLDQPYSRFKVFIDKEKEEIYMLKAIGKDGIDYTIFLINLRYNLPINDSKFTFKTSEYPKVEVIDMRF
ncbi:MAG: outer membrane lipoprotein carrier protein LolA [Bacteroidales bacterium]|nr:outer membrane lipoprotein carrier protein LolA [Bacteroidales bacterium]